MKKHHAMLINNCAIVLVVLLFVGCVSQSGEHLASANFDQIKAAKTRVSLGLTYLKNGNYSQAKFNLDKALEFAPRSADVNFALAYYYQKVGEVDKAEEGYLYAMDLDPRNADIINSYGAFLCQNGKYQQAKEYFLKAINTSNYVSSADTYENLALCSQSSGHPEEAVEYLRSAVNHQPGRANSLYLLTRSLIETKQWQEARTVLRRYEKVAQVSPQSLLMAIEIEKGSGNYATAKEFRDMLIKVYPSHPEVLALLKNKESFSTPVKKMKKVQKTLESKVAEPNNSQLTVQQQIDTADDMAIEAASKQTEKAIEPNSKVVNLAEQDGDIELVQAQESSEVEELEQKVVVETEKNSEATGKPSYHIVAKGENLYRISLMYNIKMQRLVEWNGLPDASAIYQGMKLTLVAPNSEE